MIRFSFQHTVHRVLPLLALGAFITALALTGCSGKKDSGALQQENDVAGFLFHFDQREETRALVKYKNDGQLPVSVTWYYPKGGMPEEAQPITESAAQEPGIETVAEDAPAEAGIEAVTEDGFEAVTEGDGIEAVTEGGFEAVTEGGFEAVTEGNGFEAVTEGGFEAVTEGSNAETEPAYKAVTLSDPDRIIEIYNALNNVIIVGNANSHVPKEIFYIAFTLPDGSECRFEFVSENTIRLSDHNYSIETDGTLWKALTF